MSKFCKNCGTELKDDDLFCISCGSKTEPVATATNNTDSTFNTGNTTEFGTTSNPTGEATNSAPTNAGGIMKKLNQTNIEIKGKKIPVLPVIIIAALLVILLLAKVIFGGSSYKDPFDKFAKGINNCNSSTFESAFLPCLASDYSLDKLTNKDLKEVFEDTSFSYKVTDKTRIKSSKLDDVVEDCDFSKSVSATDGYYVTIKYTIKADGEKESDTIDDILVLKVKGKWYISSSDIFNLVD